MSMAFGLPCTDGCHADAVPFCSIDLIHSLNGSCESMSVSFAAAIVTASPAFPCQGDERRGGGRSLCRFRLPPFLLAATVAASAVEIENNEPVENKMKN